MSPLKGDRVGNVSFQGRGCAISPASAGSLMTEILRGKTLAEADALFKGFHAKVTGTAPSAVSPAPAFGAECYIGAVTISPDTRPQTHPV